MTDKLLTVADAAERLHVSPQYIHKLIKEGAVKSVKSGEQYLISLIEEV